MKKRFKIIVSAVLLMAVVFSSSPAFVFAQAQQQTQQSTRVGVDDSGKPITSTKTSTSQGSTYRNGVTQSGASTDATDSLTGAVGCSAGQILASLLTSAITSGSNIGTTIAGEVAPIAGGAAASVAAVPTAEYQTSELNLNTQYIKKNADRLREDSNTQTAAHTGQVTYGGILLGGSWDGIAFCLINAIIEYIADATIAWANSGFNGNPAFVDNPEQFFTDIADQEAASFIQGIVKNTTGVNVCQPFRVQIAVNLSKSYGNQQKKQQCSIDSIVKNYDSFVNNNFNEGGWEGWLSLTQNDANNRYGAYKIANEQMYAAISAKNNTAQVELGWNKGFLSYKTCEDKKDPASCKNTTPGTLIQSSLEKTLNLPKDRLVIAQKFDQVISAIVNNLIKVALNEVLTSKSSGGSSSSN